MNNPQPSISSSQPQQADFDIVIAGGGMVGISLALLLSAQNHHWRILLLEAHAYQQTDTPVYRPSFDARSTALSWSSRNVFEKIGVWPALGEHVSAIEQIHVSDRGHVGLTRISAEEASVDALGYVVENRWLGEVLLNKMVATDAEIVAPASIERVKPFKSGMLLTLDDSREVKTSLLVIADGAGSKTAAKMGIHSRVKPYGQSGIIANLTLEKPHRGIAFERFTDQGPMALLPLEDFQGKPRSALVWTQPTDQVEQLLSAGGEEFLERLQKRLGYRLGQLQQVGERFAYPLALTTASEQVRRHLVVMGNAAHTLHPVAGQGFNLSLRDAATLAEVLGSARVEGHEFASLDVLENYQKRQAQDQQNTILFSDSLPKLFGLPSAAVALARNSGLVAMDLIPPLRNRFARFGMGLATREARHG